jgi:hypothetical protein
MSPSSIAFDRALRPLPRGDETTVSAYPARCASPATPARKSVDTGSLNAYPRSSVNSTPTDCVRPVRSELASAFGPS